MFRKATKEVASRNTCGFSHNSSKTAGTKIGERPEPSGPLPKHLQGTNDLARVLAVLHHRNRAAHTTNHHHTVKRIHARTTLNLAELSNQLLLQAAPQNEVVNNPQDHQRIHCVDGTVINRRRRRRRTRHTLSNPATNEQNQQHSQHEIAKVTARIHIITDITALRTTVHGGQVTLIATHQRIILTLTSLRHRLTFTSLRLLTVINNQRLTTSRLLLLTRRSRTALLRGELRINRSLRLLYNLRLNSFRFSLLFLTTKHPPIIPERHTPNPPPQAHTSN